MQNALNYIYMGIIASIILIVIGFFGYKLYERDEFYRKCEDKDGTVIKNELDESFCFRPSQIGEHT
jgi:hypothetical protein